MTVNELQNELIMEIECITKDMEMYNKDGKRAGLKGYQQSIPMLLSVDYEGTEDALFPYFTVVISSVMYNNPEADGENTAHIMVIFGIYDDDEKMRGYFTLSAIMQRVIMRFMENQTMGLFYCDKKMRMEFQEDDTAPQFFGGIEMIWYLPEIETEEME